jgi:hypothetical protein
MKNIQVMHINDLKMANNNLFPFILLDLKYHKLHHPG